MKWLTLDAIKMHSRLDFEGEEALLEMYGDAAEETVLNILGRTYTELVENYGTEKHPVPTPIVQASLLLVEHSYTHRAPAEIQQLHTVPYGIELLLKPYMRLADKTGREGCL